MIEDLFHRVAGAWGEAGCVGTLSNLSTWEVGTGWSEFKFILTYIASSRLSTENLSKKPKTMCPLPQVEDLDLDTCFGLGGTR